MDSANGQGGFYFALLRLIARLRHGTAARSESNAAEAYVVGASIFLLSFVFLSICVGWRSPPLLLLLLFATWIFWVLLLYTNSLIVRVTRFTRVARTCTNSRLQSTLIGFESTGFAIVLVAHRDPARVLGALWLVVVAANLVAALLLAAWQRSDSR